MKFVQLVVALAIASSQVCFAEAAVGRRNQEEESRPRGTPRAATTKHSVIAEREEESIPRVEHNTVKEEVRQRQKTKARAEPTVVDKKETHERQHTKTRTKPVAAAKEAKESQHITDTRTKTKSHEPRTKHDHPHARDDGPSQIVNGQDADIGEYPYFVDLDGCGGSLIAPQVVLTAAHCAPIIFAGKNVIINGYERGTVTSGAFETSVLMYGGHPDYDEMNMANDIMLLQLEEPITVTTPVTLSLNDQQSVPARGQMLTVIGVGNTEEGGEQADILQELEVPTVSLEACNAEDSYDGAIIDDVMFCSGVQEGGVDSCQGDSGGPIVAKDGDSHVQVGVVSWGYGCAQPNFPGVYARTSSAMEWIQFVTCSCWGDSTSATFCPADVVARPGWECPAPAPTGCELIEGWSDADGDTCAWYEENDEVGCASTGGSFTGASGITAWEACCHCEGGQYSTSAPSDSSSSSPGCEIIAGWVDSAGDGCAWYEEVDEAGCPNTGGSFMTADGMTAWDACCHCYGGGDSQQFDSNDDTDVGCSLVEGWTDAYGDTCEWYERNDHKGCPLYGAEVGVNGTTVGEACCICRGDGCELVEGWKDSYGDPCLWYEMNDEPGCPQFWNLTSTDGITAEEGCCHCAEDPVASQATDARDGGW